MKNLFLASCIGLMAISTSASAQDASSAAEQVSVQDEIRATSAQLKEAYGILSQDIAHLNREIGPDATKATPEQDAMRARMQKSLSQLEGMLTTVNTANEEQWAEIKAKAETVRTGALSLVKERTGGK
ncbi:MAG: hypothetical protein IPP83_18225 [Flavobacteriales bacterium]|nr:hypothetical protein [Flavobacteriales bacterium]